VPPTPATPLKKSVGKDQNTGNADKIQKLASESLNSDNGKLSLFSN